MDAEIIAVGSEMLTPQRVDTNSLYLTAQLNSLGVEVVTKCVIGDDRDRLAVAIRQALDRTALVILSGGLGPTEDDVTREAAAQALDRKLAFHPEIAEALEQRFLRAKRKMAEINKRQAFVIQGADVLSNDRGTAPGQWVEESGRFVMLLPGPPHELQSMFERQCLPRLGRILPRQVIRTAFFRVTGMAESELDQLISPVYKKYSNPATTILAANGDLQIHLRARCGSEQDAAALLDEVSAPIELLLGDRLYSRNGDPLEKVVGDLLLRLRATVSVAESCTGGMLGERFTSIPGSSAYFAGGFVTYTEAMKKELLGIPGDLLDSYGAVSAETAEAMAVQARRRTSSTFALSITGVAGPDPGVGPGGHTVPVGTVYVGFAGQEGARSAHRQFFGDRQRIRIFTCQMALDILRRRLLAIP